jgi:uncharacterized protein YuzE
MNAKLAYYDREADIAWLPTGDSDWGLIDHDSVTGDVVAIEVWSASKRLPACGSRDAAGPPRAPTAPLRDQRTIFGANRCRKRDSNPRHADYDSASRVAAARGC